MSYQEIGLGANLTHKDKIRIGHQNVANRRDENQATSLMQALEVLGQKVVSRSNESEKIAERKPVTNDELISGIIHAAIEIAGEVGGVNNLITGREALRRMNEKIAPLISSETSLPDLLLPRLKIMRIDPSYSEEEVAEYAKMDALRGIHTRGVNALSRSGYQTVGAIQAASMRDLLQIPNSGTQIMTYFKTVFSPLEVK